MSQGVEIAAAYVTVIPSFKGFNKAMTKEITAALGGSAVGNEAAKMGAKVGAAVGRETSKSFRQAGGDLVQSINAPLSKVGGVFARSVAMSAGAIARPLGKVAGDAGSYFATTAAAGAGKIGSAIGRSVSTAMTTAVQATLATASAGAAAIGGQVIGGGAKRAVSMNSAEAKLKALGYQGKAFEAIMASATESVDGTAYTMADAVGSSAQMLAAGIKPGKELTGILKNVGKVSDISGRSFNEMGTMLSKMASAGTIYAEDLNQLAESGIPIYAEMAKTMGVSAVEVKKLASEGKIAFSDLDKTIGAIKWDSALFAATDIKSAFNNLRSAMSKIGQKFWDPVIDGAVPMINNMKNTINALTKIIDFTPMEKKIEGFMKRMNGVFKPFQDAAGAINPKKIEAKFDEVVAKFKDFRQSIAGMEGPLVGLVAGIFGKMLSGVPLIGPMFAGIGPGVGIMIGAFAGAVTHSKALQKQLSATVTWIKDLGKSFRTKFTGLEDSLGSAKDVMKKIGDTFAIGLAAVRNIIDRVVSKIDFSPFIAKFETMMSNLKGFTGDVMDDAGNIDMSKLDAAIDSFLERFLTLPSQLKGLSAPIIGAVAGIFSGALSKIPGIGFIFQGLTPAIGLFSGVIAGAVASSDNLQNSLAKVGGFLSGVKEKMTAAFSGGEGISLKGIGDGIATAINGVMAFVDDFVGRIAERAPEIKEAFGGLFTAVSNFFGQTGEGGGGAITADVFTEITNGMTGALTTVTNIATELSNVIDTASQSPVVMGLVGFIKDLTLWAVENEDVVKTGAGILAAIFVGGKILGVIQSIAGIATAISGVAGLLGIGGAATAATGAVASGGILTAVIGGLNTAAKTIDLKLIAKVSAAIGMIVATIGGLGLLAKMMHDQGATEGIVAFGGMLTAVADVIQTFVSRWELIGAALVVVAAALAGPLLETLSIGIAKVVAIGTAFGVAIAAVAAIFGGIGKLFKEWDLMSGWQYLADAINMGVDLVLGVIDKMAGILLEHFGRFMTIISDFMTKAAMVISIMIPQITGFLITLKDIGVEAGTGALEAAKGIGALGLALAGLAGGNGLKNIGDAANAIGGKLGLTDGRNTVDMLREIVQIMGDASAKIVEMSGQWESALNGAYDFGAKVPVKMVEGLRANENMVHNKVDSMVNHFMTEAQNRLNRQPLEIKVRVDDSAVRRYRAQSMSYGGGASYSRTTNFNTNINTSDSLFSTMRRLTR